MEINFNDRATISGFCSNKYHDRQILTGSIFGMLHWYCYRSSTSYLILLFLSRIATTIGNRDSMFISFYSFHLTSVSFNFNLNCFLGFLQNICFIIYYIYYYKTCKYILYIYIFYLYIF